MRGAGAAHQFDVAVIGGGPAGSATACRLARAGRRVILFERDRFPRFHIGESLLASVNDVLDAIGADDLVRRPAFPRSGARPSCTADGAIERYADFGTAPEARPPQTWQVPRATVRPSAAAARGRERRRRARGPSRARRRLRRRRRDGHRPRRVETRDAIADACARRRSSTPRAALGLLSRKFELADRRAAPGQHRRLLALLRRAARRRAAGPATSASSRATTWAGSG